MASMAYSIGVLLALASAMVTQGCVAQGCQAAGAHHHLVQELLHRMEKSVKFDEPPNPSILLAMNLAGATHGHVHSWLLQEIKKDAVERAQTDMKSGEVALYVLALLSSCQDPHCVHAMGKTVNLIPILKQKMNEEISRNVINWYTESLDILALCLVKEYDIQKAVEAVAEELQKCRSSICVDTQAMAVLALVCAYNHTEKRDLIRDALKAVTNHFLDEQERNNGTIGNIDSMGLALQALEDSSEFYAPRKWDRAQAFNVVYAHDYHQPMAIAQVLPALVNKSYLHAASIQVHYSITNTLQGKHFHYSTTVTVPSGSTLLQVMEVAAAENPEKFCFQKKKTSWGLFVTSIHGLAGSMEDRTYWQFLSNGKALEEGVGTYKPHNGEHIQAVFSKEQDVAGLDCTATKASIQVHYSITNTLQGKHFHYSTTVTVPSGSTLLQVMEVAAAENPEKFCFQKKKMSWGLFVTSIHGLAGSMEDRTYWQFLSNGKALEEGVGTYKPHNGEHIQAVFSKEQDVAGLDCTATKASIQVHYSITNTLQGKHFHYSTTVTVPSGSTLLQVMEVAAAENPEKFCFQKKKTSWGLFVTSIHGLAGSMEDRTYWQFLSNGKALEEGVGTYKPHNGEHIQAVFSKEQDVAGLDCTATKASIQVHYSITNTLQGKHFHYSTTVTVPSGSTLLQVMEVAAAENPEKFCFQKKKTSWGLFVTSIHGLAGSMEDRTYWQFLSNGKALEEGVGTYKPHNGEHIQAVFSKEQDVAGLDCTATKASIQVHYSITNTLQGKHFHYSTTVTVPSGSTLLQVMEVAAAENPEKFCFQKKKTSWGLFVTSIHGLAGSMEDRTYWQFLSNGKALEEGVGTYKPHNGEHIQAVFSTY